MPQGACRLKGRTCENKKNKERETCKNRGTEEGGGEKLNKTSYTHQVLVSQALFQSNLAPKNSHAKILDPHLLSCTIIPPHNKSWVAKMAISLNFELYFLFPKIRFLNKSLQLMSNFVKEKTHTISFHQVPHTGGQKSIQIGQFEFHFVFQLVRIDFS